MKVSIIIPVYNNASTLRRCVDSLSVQTYKDIEIIIVNDGSEDNTATVAATLAASDKRIQVINCKNGGLSVARNTGLTVATGDIIMFVDGDDYVDSDYCQQAVANMTKYGSDICIMGYLYEEEGVVEKHVLSKQVGLMSKNEVMIKVSDLNMGNFVWCKAFRAHLFNYVKFLEGKNYEDIHIFYQLAELANKISYCPITAYHYVQHANSIATTLSKRNIHDSFEAASTQYDYFIEHYPQAAEAAQKYLLLASVRYCLYMERDKLYTKAGEYLKKLPIPVDLEKKYRWPILLFRQMPFIWGGVRWGVQRFHSTK